MKTVRILIVEDDTDAREMLVELMAAMGHSAQGAANASEALELIAAHDFDLALVDVGLPGVDGLQLARAIRARVGEQIRLIALTGYNDDETRREAKAAGFHEFLVKPIQSDGLTTVLKHFGS